MVDSNTIIEGTVKFRDGKKWKSRWCVMRKLSPVADCLHLQLYRDSKDRYKQGQTKASLSLQHFLGVETGFTLDKESNTIAIICQDVTVILAFDTRERLIQWQVKISTNLGEDQQFLIQISSAPPKSKIATGPARLHVAPDLKFCITTGVPPRLAGYWDIAHLRRYGVIEGRFCFEGGSRCGRGEGLHVCVTDQGEEIIAAFQGKVARNRRPVSRKLSAMTESPRKTDQLSRSMYSDAPQACCSGSELDPASRHHSNEDLLCPCRAHSSSSPFWSSAESASGLHHLASSSDLDSNYGCGDTASVTGIPDHFHHQDPVWAHDPGRPGGGSGGGTSSLERCASCISKLGAPSMSRSSTVTTTNTPTGAPASFSPAWTMDMVPPHHHSNCDRMSLSSHSSSGGNSEYSVPRFATPAPDWYDRPRMTPPSVPPKSPKMPPGLSIDQASACHCQCCPPVRPPKPPQMSTTDSPSKRKVKKPPMPLPTVEPTPNPCMCRQLTVGPYENYDVPKSLLGNSFQKDDNKVVAPAEDYYDTPKNMKECLAMDYGNYDTPAPLSGMMLRKPCGCVVKYTRKEPVKAQPQQEELDATRATDCPCQRVMCWATGMMMLPYCRRGHGVENTGLPIHKVKLSGEGKMPVMNPCGEIAIYATVDKSKKTNRKQPVSCNCNPEDKHKDDCPNHEASKGGAAPTDGSNYVNIEPDGSLSANSSQQPVENNANTSTAGLDYENIEFAQSLEYYENSKDLLQKVVGLTKSHGNDSEATQTEVEDASTAVSYTINNGIKFCKKCGHACHMLSPSQVETVGESEEQQDNCQDDYLMMEPAKNVKSTLIEGKHPGYLPMSPITAQQQQQCGGKLSDKSASIPSLLDRSRRVPGSAMMMMMHHHNSYLRRVLHDEDGRKSSHLHPSSRRRSSSADSSRYLDDLEDLSENTMVSSREISSSHTELSAPEVSAKEPAKDEEAENRLNCEEVVESNEQGKDDGTSTSSESGSLRTLVRESLAETAPPQQEPIPSSSSSSSAVHIRRSSSVPCKSGNNRDSSSSNDSGVSIGSLRHRGADFAEFELPLTTAMSTRRHHHAVQGRGLHHGNYYHVTSGALGGPSGMNCLHASLPRRSKSVDPLREISFQFQKDKIPAKSSSAEAEVPVCTAKRDPAKGYASPGGEGNAIVMPYMDSRSTSSGTSDMSDYIETLSLSSHSSQSDNTADSLRLGRSATTTLRPRSGKEYQLIDRTILEGEFKGLTGRGEGSP